MINENNTDYFNLRALRNASHKHRYLKSKHFKQAKVLLYKIPGGINYEKKFSCFVSILTGFFLSQKETFKLIFFAYHKHQI